MQPIAPPIAPVGRVPATISRVGGTLTVAGAAAAVLLVVLATAGQPVGVGGPGINGWLVGACLALVGIGVLAIAVGGSPPFDARTTRVGLVILGLGSSSFAAAVVLAARLATDPLEDLPSVILGAGGIGIPVGALASGGSLLRSAGSARLVGLALVAGIALVVVGILASGSGRLPVLAGSLLLMLGLGGMGVLALGFGNRATGATAVPL